ncbi:MAG TPA: hypothetical protein VHD90_20295 [Phototrophicaceae bacterium]|nr:hypothetical protein [Phototrophicaceae bacterium]
MMRLEIGLGLLAVGATVLLGTAAASAQQSTGTPVRQVLSMSTTPRLDPAPTEQDYLDAFKLTHDAGVDGNAFTAKWSDLEDSGAKYKFDDFLNGMGGYEYAYPDTLMFGIQVLNTTAKETPPDLLNVSFDDPQMLTRFDALIDAMLPKFKPYVRYLSIGNEVDVYLANHPQEWATYKTFYDGVVDHVHQVDPDVQVGVTVTYSGLLAHTDQIMTLNEHSDVFFLTYYPLETDFTANHPDAPLTDFPKMVEIARGLPVILQEVGYPSADLLHSSEADQAAFVRNVFTAWKSAGNAIPFLNYFLLHDLTEDICNQLEGYYGLKNPNFHAYLCTLGLRQANGTPKLAWQTFVDQAAAWRKSIG